MGTLTAALFFSPDLAPEIAQARYKGLVKVLHPDLATGDHELMQLLNGEFDAFQQKRLLPRGTTQAASQPPPFDPMASYWAIVRQRIEREISLIPIMPGVTFETDSLHQLIIATGKGCYDCREALKLYSFRWDPTRKVWAKAVNV